MIIGLSGTLAAGKDTVAEYLVEREGFDHISLSVILRKIAMEKGLGIDLGNLTLLGNSLKDEYGPGYLVKRAKKETDFNKDITVSSIRQPEEIEELKKEKNFFMIFVDADDEIRFNRLVKRGRVGDTNRFEKFQDLEKKQLDGQSGGINLGKCREMADYVLENNGTLVEFENKIRVAFEDIEKRVKSGE